MPLVTLSIAAVATALHVLGLDVAQLAYQPAAPTMGTLLGCHLVHFSGKHFVWDVLTFTALGVVSESRLRGRYLDFLASSALIVPPLACWLTPWVTHYAGLSGLVIGQVSLWTTVQLRRQLLAGNRRRAALAALGLALLFGKQLYECANGQTSLVTLHYDGFSTVPAAHLCSVLAGCFAAQGPPPRRRQNTCSPRSCTRAA